MKITPTAALDFKVAQPDDLSLVMEILAEPAAWLKEKSIDQWPSPPNKHWQQRMAEAIEREEVHTVGIAQNRFGMVRFTWVDPYWPDDNLAGYVHSIAVRSEMHGQNLGGLILFWAVMKTKQEWRQFLRLDCLAGNGRLRRYYEEQGFIYRGAVNAHDYAAALYEKEIGQNQ